MNSVVTKCKVFFQVVRFTAKVSVDQSWALYYRYVQTGAYWVFFLVGLLPPSNHT